MELRTRVQPLKLSDRVVAGRGTGRLGGLAGEMDSPRQGNTVAHALVRRVRLCCSFEVWMENVPPSIFNVLQADLPAN